MKKNIIVSGSLAYDRIMDFPGYFSEHILPEKIHMLSVTFRSQASRKIRWHGGQYRLRAELTGEHPVIAGAIGLITEVFRLVRQKTDRHGRY